MQPSHILPVIRPSTRGELLASLKAGIACEVAEYVAEFTNLCLDGILKFEGKYKVENSSNPGWVIYSSIIK